ncbi:GIY-YIG nuclease family protein [Streptomyces sp. NPDC002640]
MGQTFTVPLKVAGHRLESVSISHGIIGGDARRNAPTFGTVIDVPAVIELLDLVVSGAVTATEARDSLSDLAIKINEHKAREYAHLEELMNESWVTPRPAERPKQLDSRWVYAISAEDKPEVLKIGVATSIEKRMKGLQIGTPTPLVLRWSSRGGYTLERHLHEVFRERQVSSEWFNFGRVKEPVEEIAAAASSFLAQFQEQGEEA